VQTAGEVGRCAAETRTRIFRWVFFFCAGHAPGHLPRHESTFGPLFPSAGLQTASLSEMGIPSILRRLMAHTPDNGGLCQHVHWHVQLGAARHNWWRPVFVAIGTGRGNAMFRRTESRLMGSRKNRGWGLGKISGGRGAPPPVNGPRPRRFRQSSHVSPAPRCSGEWSPAASARRSRQPPSRGRPGWNWSKMQDWVQVPNWVNCVSRWWDCCLRPSVRIPLGVLSSVALARRRTDGN